LLLPCPDISLESCPVVGLELCPIAGLESCPVVGLESVSVADFLCLDPCPVAGLSSCPVSCPVVGLESCPAVVDLISCSVNDRPAVDVVLFPNVLLVLFPDVLLVLCAVVSRLPCWPGNCIPLSSWLDKCVKQVQDLEGVMWRRMGVRMRVDTGSGRVQMCS
jgi:hypothetical protein